MVFVRGRPCSDAGHYPFAGKMAYQLRSGDGVSREASKECRPSCRGLVEGPMCSHSQLHRSFASLRMTRRIYDRTWGTLNLGPQYLTIAANDLGSSDAPPTSAPSISSCDMRP